jgi:nucleotide-binding universal stress UspA family protein
MPQRILVAIDGSDHGAKAVEFASAMAKALGGQLYLVHAVTDRALSDDERRLAETEYSAVAKPVRRLEPALTAADPDFVPRKVFAELRVGEAAAREVIGRHLLDEARARADKAGADVAEAILEGGNPAAVITGTAQRLHADHIVMGARGLGNVTGILLGSVSQKVIHDALCPCTVVK